MRTFNGLLMVIAMGAVGAGCDHPDATVDASSSKLGIARYSVQESPTTTTVIGLDADGVEVGRLELTHGVFTLSEPFTEDYTTPAVNGRKLSVDVLDQKMRWETAGYEPVLHMPAHPSQDWAVAVFLADSHVKPVLDRWGIGFDTVAVGLSGESEYADVVGSYRGKSPMSCDHMTSCGSTLNGTINTCGGGGAAIDAARLTQSAGTNCGVYTSSYNQVLLAQCCPAGTGGQSVTWFAQKACPSTTDNNTSCGTRSSGACKACPTYPQPATATCSANYGSTVGLCSGSIYQITYEYADCFPSCSGCNLGEPDGCGGTCPSGGCPIGKQCCGGDQCYKDTLICP